MPDDLDLRLTHLADRLAAEQATQGFGTRALWMRTTVHGADVRMTSGGGDVSISVRSDEHPLMSATLGPDGTWRAGTITDPRSRLGGWIDDLERATWTCAWTETMKQAA